MYPGSNLGCRLGHGPQVREEVFISSSSLRESLSVSTSRRNFHELSYCVKYNFKLLAAEKYRGRDVYRVSFEPKPHQDFDEAAWKGEAMIDAAEFQPVSVHSKLALKIPKAVKVLLGTVP